MKTLAFAAALMVAGTMAFAAHRASSFATSDIADYDTAIVNEPYHGPADPSQVTGPDTTDVTNPRQ